MAPDNPKDWKKIKDAYENNIEPDDAEDLSVADQEAMPITDEKISDIGPDYEELEKKIKVAEQKAEQNWDKAIRALAELDNVRRGAERDITKAHRYGLEKFVADSIPVADAVNQALSIAEKSSDLAMVEGLKLIEKLLLDVFAKHHVQELNPINEQFNPHEHEAMAMQDLPDALPNSIIAVFQKGYKLHDRVVRPARVVVAKAPRVAE